VEQLSALPAPGKETRLATSRVSMGPRSAVVASAPGATDGPSDLAQALLSWVRVLRPVRAVLSVLIALHVVAVVVFSQGSLALLLIMVAAWWVLGWLTKAAPKVLSSAAVGVIPQVAPLQERLRHLSQQRTTVKKKPQ
jgi:hypothetical protein